MEDIVGFKLRDRKRGRNAILTWGRVFDPVDPEPLLKAVSQGLTHFGISSVERISLCTNLHEVEDFPYFFEMLSLMTMKGIPFGKRGHGAWKLQMQRGIIEGKEIYCLGFLTKPSKTVPATVGARKVERSA